MDRFFSAILQTGIYSLGIILIIVLLRIAFKKRASKTVLCALWLFAAIRLMLPLQLESDYALLPDISIINNDENTVASENEESNVAEIGILQENDTTPVSMDIANGNISENYEISPEVNTKTEETEVRENSIGDTDYLKPVLDNGEESASAIPNSDTGHDNAVSVLSVLGYIWLAGIAVFILLMVRRYVNVKKKLKDAVLLAPYDDVYSSNAISSAFVFGIIKPGIYVSSSVKTEQLDYVLAHERAHISRKDYITKLLAYLILSVYWFVPWVWAAYILFGRDVELACDEKVILEKSETYRADYAQVLLDSTISYSHKEAGLVSFGEEKIKDRIESVVKYKKKSLWISLAVIVMAGIGLAIFFFIKASGNKSKDIDSLMGQKQQILVEALETDYGDFSQNISDAIMEDYEKYAEMDQGMRFASSHAVGTGAENFSTWKEATEFVGVTPWNPLENADWLKLRASDTRKKNYSANYLGDIDGKLNSVSIMNTYPLQSGHIEYCINLYTETRHSAWPDEENENVLKTSFDVANNGTNKTISADIRFIHTDKIDAVTIAFPNAYNYKYMFNIVSLSGIENLTELVDLVCETIGLPTDYKDIKQRLYDQKTGEIGTGAEHSITYVLGDYKELFTLMPDRSNAGEQVEIRTRVLYDADLHVSVDGLEITKSHSDSDYWGYTFTMPDADVKVTAEMYNKGELNGYSELFYDYENNPEKIIGMYYIDVCKTYGEASGTLSGFWGDIYTNKNGESLILYYDNLGLVESIKKEMPDEYDSATKTGSDFENDNRAMLEAYTQMAQKYYDAQAAIVENGGDYYTEKLDENLNRLYFGAPGTVYAEDKQTFLLHDLNNDGTPEFFIARLHHGESKNTVYAGYTWKDGELCQLMPGVEIGYRSGTIDIRADGKVLSFFSGSAWDYGVEVYSLPKNGTDLIREEKAYASRVDGDGYGNSYSRYYKKTEGQDPVEISEVEYEQFISGFKEIPLNFIENTPEGLEALRK